MPIYEYTCEACGHRFEKLMKIGAEPPPCTSCGEDRAKKLVSASAFVLKGSGWYKDHYGLKKGGASGGEASASSEGSSTSAAPSTPAPSAAPAAPSSPAAPSAPKPAGKASP